MCGGSKSNLCPLDSDMSGISHKSLSKLLELAATDDLSSFIHQVEEMGCEIKEPKFWYSRSFASKKMGFVERTPLMIASLYGSIEVLNYIIQTCKVDVNKASATDSATALHCAAAGGAWSCVEVVELLIGAGADINALDVNGKKAGDLIAPCIKSFSRKKLEMVLNGAAAAAEEIRPAKEYQMEVCLPDINSGVYGSDEFRMYSFKVKPCSRAYSHDWTECPFAHPGENARRRDPVKYNYSCVPCPEFKKGSCGKGDGCEYSHGVFESWLHPAQYRTRLCKDEIGCTRKVCFFAHKQHELRPLHAATGSALPSPTSTLPIMWQPVKGVSASRLKSSLAARDVDFDLKPTNVDEVFGSLDLPHLQLQGMSHNMRASYPSVAAAVMNSRSSAFSNRSQSFVDRGGVGSPTLMASKFSDWSSPDGKLDWGFNGEDASRLRKSASFGLRASLDLGLMQQCRMDHEQMVA